MYSIQSRIAWQTINEVSGRKSTVKAKLKAASQQEKVKLWEQHFKNLLGNPPEITDEPNTRIISKQLDVKLGPFTKEELDSVLRRIKNRKAAGLYIYICHIISCLKGICFVLSYSTHIWNAYVAGNLLKIKKREK